MKTEVQVTDMPITGVVFSCDPDDGSGTERDGASFLLSLAGMFDSGPNDTSEHVNSVVSDFILEKSNDLSVAFTS